MPSGFALSVLNCTLLFTAFPGSNFQLSLNTILLRINPHLNQSFRSLRSLRMERVSLINPKNRTSELLILEVLSIGFCTPFA
jgi:hypothetical protein